MKIGFLISGIGIFGSVREVVENCNVLSELGNECFIFNPEGEIIPWIECKAKIVHESKLHLYSLDVLILTTTPNDHYLRLFKQSKADKKVFCFMGFDPKFNIFELNPNLTYIVENYYLMADSFWQIDWLKENTKSDKILNCQLGGINLEMFSPMDDKVYGDVVIGWSGDMRKRKGGITLYNYFTTKDIGTKTYFGKRIPQNQMKDWFNEIDIFVDNHYSGGWCNPVIEAMACGVPVVCSNVLCNSAFTIDGRTALKFEFNDMTTMHEKIKILQNEGAIRYLLSVNGREAIKEFDYKIIGQKLNDTLLRCW
jgi:glycosyltransferase involved in cell wall biosynthesis